MNECKKVQRELVAFLSEELERDKHSYVVSHINKCPECRKELTEIEQILEPTAALGSDIEAAMYSVNWETLPEQIADRVFKKSTEPEPKIRKSGIFHSLWLPSFKPVYAGVLIGIFIGSLVTFMLLRNTGVMKNTSDEIIIPWGFLDRIEIELARKETLDYLDKSQYLLLDFIQPTDSQSPDQYPFRFTSERAKDLLSKKKYINQQLDRFQMAKAKEICDQIEFLFFELSQISEDLSEQELKRIQDLIRDRQLLLKIKLIKEELREESEV